MSKMCRYESPIGRIFLESDKLGLTGLWFEGQKYFPEYLSEMAESRTCPFLCSALQWLDIYFSGKEPDFTPPLHLEATAFQKLVWAQLLNIPYGSTLSYGELAKTLALSLGKEKMSARAVGCAVGRNRISLIIPCHRVIGSDATLVGYAGGIEKKAALLTLEGINIKTVGKPSAL